MQKKITPFYIIGPHPSALAFDPRFRIKDGTKIDIFFETNKKSDRKVTKIPFSQADAWYIPKCRKVWHQKTGDLLFFERAVFLKCDVLVEFRSYMIFKRITQYWRKITLFNSRGWEKPLIDYYNKTKS